MDYRIRVFDPSDLPSLALIYKASIRYLGSQHYSSDQIAAWASYADDVEEFAMWINRAKTFVASNSRGTCLGFGGLEHPSRISSLFVSPQIMRKGVGSALLKCLIAEVTTRGLLKATTEASEFSKPLFEKFGFRVKNVEPTEFKGVAFTRYAMELQI